MSRSWRALVGARKQNDERDRALDEIDVVPRTIVDPHFRDATAHRLHVARVSDHQTIDARLNACARSASPPARAQNSRSAGHRAIGKVSYGIREIKRLKLRAIMLYNNYQCCTYLETEVTSEDASHQRGAGQFL